MSIAAGVIVTITFQQVDGTPNAETGTQSDNQSLKNFDSRVEEFHSLFSFIIKRFRSFVHTRNLVVLRCITAARLIFWCTFLTGIKIKPPTGSGRRERISIHHDELISGLDFFFAVQIFFNIEGVFGVVVRGQLVVRVLGQVVLVAQKRSDATQLQNTLAAVQHRQLVPAQQFPAVKSSDEFAKEKTLPVKKTRRVTIINVISCEFSILD